jgi:hypothetical protein
VGRLSEAHRLDGGVRETGHYVRQASALARTVRGSFGLPKSVAEGALGEGILADIGSVFETGNGQGWRHQSGEDRGEGSGGRGR